MAFDPDAYLSGGAATKQFDPDVYLASDTTLPEVVATQPEGGGGFLAKINAALRKPSPEALQAPEAAVRELVTGMLPHDLESYAAGIFPPLGAYEQGKALAQGDVSSIPFVGRVPEIAQAEDTPAGSKERYLAAMKTLMDVGMLGGASSERAPSPLRTEPLAPEPPPTQSMGPGTIAGDVSRALERRFELQPTPPEAPPQLAPAPPIEQTLPKIGQPLPFNPELGPEPQPDFQMPLRTETQQFPPPPIGTPLKPVPLLGPDGTTAADVAAAQAAPPPPVPPAGAPVAEAPEPYTPEAAAARAAQQPSEPQAAPIGASNEIARAREQAGLTEAPPSGIGIGWHESVAQGNALIDKGADAYKVVSDFQKTGNISGEKMSVARAWLERLQRANQEARGDLEQNPTNPDLQRTAVDAEAAENAFWQGYQPMKTEWSKIGTGMQEQRGITDTDLLSQKTAEQVMRENIDRELTAADKARAAKAVKDTRQANANVDTAFDKAISEASRKAKGAPRSLEQLKNDLAAKLKELTPC